MAASRPPQLTHRVAHGVFLLTTYGEECIREDSLSEEKQFSVRDLQDVEKAERWLRHRVYPKMKTSEV